MKLGKMLRKKILTTSSDNSGEKEEMEIVAGDDATHFFLTNVKDGDKLKVDTAFNGSNSGYSVTIINDGNEEVRNNEVYNMGRLPQQK